MDNRGFQRSKERFIIAEVFFKKPNLSEDDRRAVVALIEDAGDSKTLKARLKDWETPTGGSSSFISTFKSLFVSKEQTSLTVEEAVRRSRGTRDQEFLATLSNKVSDEPLLQQLAQDAVAEAHRYFREFMERSIPKLCFSAQNTGQKMMYRQVQLGAEEQDQKRRASLRSDWCNEIKLAQSQANTGYVVVSPAWTLLFLILYILGSRTQCSSMVLRRCDMVGLQVSSRIPFALVVYLTLDRIQICCRGHPAYKCIP